MRSIGAATNIRGARRAGYIISQCGLLVNTRGILRGGGGGLGNKAATITHCKTVERIYWKGEEKETEETKDRKEK